MKSPKSSSQVGRHLLSIAIRQITPAERSALNALLGIDINMRMICEALAEYLTLKFPGKEGPLLTEVLHAAARTYLDASSEEAGSEVAESAFLRALTNAAVPLTQVRITVGEDNNQIAWEPFKESLTAFLLGNGFDPEKAPCEVINERVPGCTDADEEALRMALAVRIMPLGHALLTRKELREAQPA